MVDILNANKIKIMKLEHVAIWTGDLEALKTYYQRYFGGIAGARYTNEKKGFQSYFLSFQSGARLELMSMKSIPHNQNDTVQAQHRGIIHIAFGVDHYAGS
jgi:lactoylglutathione lyase